MFEREEESGVARLTLPGSGNVLGRTISDQDTELGWNVWQSSGPIPGVTILRIMEIYHGIQVVLTKSEAGKYAIYQTVNRRKFVKVHEHDSRIYGIFPLDMGAALFCADDGWFITINSGTTWSLFTAAGPVAEVAVVVGNISVLGYYAISAYGSDRKLYYCEYPGGVWSETLDTTTIYTGQWYPALDGAQVGLLAGAGNQLLLSQDNGKTWVTKTVAEGIIKSIAASDKSSAPSFLVNILSQGAVAGRLYWTHDLGDSLVPNISGVDSAVSAESVFLTGTNEKETLFAVIGHKEGSEGSLIPRYRLIRRA